MSAQSSDIPERIGRYEIVERLAAGGMGEVFVARVAGPGGFLKAVALKRIHPHLASDTKFIGMLHDEARLAAAVEHPSIVRTLDVGSSGDTHYVVLDYVSGDQVGKLHRELSRRDELIPAWLVAWIGASTADALHAVHEARGLDGVPLEIVHRDVSPGNIMLADSGHVMLFDFGVAKARHRIAETAYGVLKGKLSYMAPETFDGLPANRTVDVFALGVVLFELLTSRTPFQRANDVDTIAALRGAEIPPPSKLRAGVDNLLDEIILKAMSRKRETRFANAAELATALRRWAVLTAAPQDANAAAAWLAAAFPERIAWRRALLARVAGGQLTPPGGRKRMVTGEPTLPSSISTEVMTTPSNALDGLGTGAGLARPTTTGRTKLDRAPRRRLVAFAVAFAALALGAAAAFAIHTLALPPTDPTPATTGVPSPTAEDQPSDAPESTAPPNDSTALSPSASAKGTQDAPEKGTQVEAGTQKGTQVGPGKGTQVGPRPVVPKPRGGPLEREYD